MISRKKIEKTLRYTESQYDKCWTTLCALKMFDKSKNIAEPLMEFQGDLAETLIRLTYIHKEIARERKSLGKRMNSLNRDWFINRMRTLKDYESMISTANSIGKCLGDAYVWFWYRFERDQIRDHVNKEECFYMPTGIGGAGELETIRQLKYYGQNYILLHGITNMLRIGDVSLFDMKTMKLTGLGEIKSDKSRDEKNELNVSMYFVGPKTRSDFGESSPESKGGKERGNAVTGISPERLGRQINKMAESLNGIDKERDITKEKRVQKEMYLEELDRLVLNGKKGGDTVKIDSGLVFASVCSKRKTLTSRIMNGMPDETSGVNKELIHSIFDEKLKHNTVAMGSIHFNNDKRSKCKVNLMPGTIPLFWQKLDLETIRKIYFLEVMVITMYNPGHLINSLERDGLEFSLIPKKGMRVSKQTENGEMVFGHFYQYIDWIKDYLHSEESTRQLVLTATEESNKRGKEGYGRINMDLKEI